MVTLSRKIQTSQVTLESAGPRFKHLAVALSGDQEIAGVLESPDIWALVQQDTMKRVRRGDTVTVISSDGLTIADQAMVVRAEAGRLWFSKPLRMVKLEEIALYEDGQYAVVAVGVGYSLKVKRDGSVDSRVFNTVDAAKQEILRRQPIKVA